MTTTTAFIALALAIFLLAYLAVAIARPDRF